MTDFPTADDLIAAYEDNVEALERVWHARLAVTADARSRFHGLPVAALQDRLERDRDELDQWVVMMLVSSFEAAVHTDARDRIDCRSKDDIRKPLRDLYDEYEPRVRLEDILDLWSKHVAIGTTVNQTLRRLLRRRHWLAHGRHWVDKKSGLNPSPWDAKLILDSYVQEVRRGAPDFPRT